jgi:ATP-dependent exoDNAse (exonuclease V) alpha subunit
MSFELILPFLRPIESLLLDENVSEIMGNPDASWWYERDGIMFQEQTISFDAGKLQTGLEVIANQLGKKLDEDNPLLHVQLPDGSRLAAVIPPVVRCTPALIIRKFTSRHYTVDDLIVRGTLTRALADCLAEQIRSGKTLLISGGTGTGKTTTLAVIRNAAESQGYQVEGFAPTSRAARQLNDAGIESGTLQSFLAHTPNPDLREQRHFYLVDESSLTSTNQMREFLSRLGSDDRVLLIGDIRQHQGVEAGRPFEQLQDAGMRTATLDDIVRQRDPALKSAVELLATGQVSAALDILQQQGSVKEIPNQEERVRAIAKSYVESPQNTLIVSPDNASRRELNLAVRQELKATGAVAPEDRNFHVLIQRQDMTGAERSWASHYEIDDVVRYARGSKAIGIEAAAYASVVAINPSANELTVNKANGELATYDPRRLTGVSVYQEIQREFAVGDRIQFTAPDKSLGVANRDMAAIETIHPDGRLSVRLDNNRLIEFNPNEHRHLDHGYAVTSHSSQGLTAERILVHGDTNVHPDLLNSRFAYVSISRASLDAKVYTNDTAELGQRLSGEVSKSSAIEFSHSTANAMADLSLGRGV